MSVEHLSGKVQGARTGFRVETRTRAASVAAVVALVIVAGLVLLPLVADRRLIQDVFFILTMLSLAQYWNLLAGYAGLVSVGQQAFVGIGAYALFALTLAFGLDPIVSILLAGIIAAALSVPTAFIVFRLNGAYFAIGTWVVAEVYRLVAAQWKLVGGGTGTSLSREATGNFAALDLVRSLLDVKSSAARDILSYWMALALAVLTIALAYRLLRSRFGLALSAIRDNERASESLGVDAFRTKAAIYVIAAFGTGLTGALIYFQKARISPDAAFSVLDWTANVIFIVVIGGIGTIEGPIVGVIVFFLLQTYLADFGSWYLIALGTIAILVMLFARKGLWGLLAERTGLQLFPVRRRLILDQIGKETDGRPD